MVLFVIPEHVDKQATVKMIFCTLIGTIFMFDGATLSSHSIIKMYNLYKLAIA